MSVKVGHLFRKRTVRDLSGNIVDMRDDANGGVIISRGRVVNQQAIDELAKKELDRKTAAVAMTAQVEAPAAVVETRVAAPSKLEALEKRIDSQDAKLDAILAALKK